MNQEQQIRINFLDRIESVLVDLSSSAADSQQLDLALWAAHYVKVLESLSEKELIEFNEIAEVETELEAEVELEPEPDFDLLMDTPWQNEEDLAELQKAFSEDNLTVNSDNFTIPTPELINNSLNRSLLPSGATCMCNY